MEVIIRREQTYDFQEVNQLTFLAFQNMEFSDGDERELVINLRRSKDFIPELSLVAEFQGVIAGHILFTTSRILTGKKVVMSLTLAPVSVLPGYQKQGIGSLLIKNGLRIAKKLGHTNVNVLGHPDYYPKFGFIPASKFGISIPLKVPEGAFMMLELVKNSLNGVHGTIQFAKEFGI